MPALKLLPPTGLACGRQVLRIDCATAGYDAAHPLIRDVSFSMIGPERVAIVGPNGSGKTTLLKVIPGALKPPPGPCR